MSAISLKSITGITSITTPSGVDNVFTVHTNDTTERFRIDQTGNLNIAGIVTVTKDLDVDGHTNLDNVSIAGITTVAGNIIGSQTQTFIGADTSDGSDNKSMMLGGGGSSSVSRGAYVWVKGNEYSGAGGELILAGGGVSSSLIDFFTNSGQRARITSTGELNIGGSYTQTTNKLNVTGTAYVSSDITAGDDIIAADEIRNNVPGDFWASDNTFINLNGYGNLTHMGGFETNLTSNGYRDTNGQWKSLAANSNTGAAQIGLQPQGNIIFRTDASKSNGTAHNPSERLKIKSDGNILVGTGGDLEMSSTGRIFVGNGGNATNPMFANISDTNTGIAFPSADTLLFTTGGTERLRITSSGVLNVPAGIGPQLRFENQHSVTADAAISTFDDASGTLLCLGSNFYINSSGSETRYNTSEESTGIILNRQGYINFNTGGTGATAVNRIQITETGKVQIGLPGTTSSLPGGTEVVNIRAASNANLIVRNIGSLTSSPAGAGVGIDILNDASNTVMDLCLRGHTVIFRNRTAETLRIDSSGRSLFSGTLGYANLPLGGNAANAALQIRCQSQYQGIAFGEGATNATIGRGANNGALIYTANANPANLGGGTKVIHEWHSGTAGGSGPGRYMALDTDGDLTLDAGSLKVASGQGIDFSAHGNTSSMTSELFDDYEEGTWLPSFYPQSSAMTHNYNLRSGIYVKIGSVVYWHFRMRLSGLSGQMGQTMGFAGLPYTVDSSQPQFSANFYGESYNGETPTGMFYDGGTTRGTLYYHKNDVQNRLYASDLNPTNSYTCGSGFYFAA